MAAILKPLRYRLYFNFNHESNEYGPYQMHYFTTSYFVKKINGTEVANHSYYLDENTTTEIQQLYLNNKITMSTRFTIQSIPDDEKYDILTTDKDDAQCIEQNALFANTGNDDQDNGKKVNYEFIENCLVLAEMSKHSDSSLHFGINHNIWSMILKIFPYFYFADYIVIGIKIAWCFTSFWYLIFIDTALTFIAFLIFYLVDNINILSATNIIEYIATAFMILFDSSQIFYAYILPLSSAFNDVIKKLLRKRYFQNSCSIFVNQNEFICKQSHDHKIIAFLKNTNYHVLNIMSLYLFRVYLKNLREDGGDNEAIDECESFIKEGLEKYQNCLRSSHKSTHQIFGKCHCAKEHSFIYAKDGYISSLHKCYFNHCYPRYFGAVLVFYTSFYIIGFFVQNVIDTELSAIWSLTLAISLYTRLFVNIVLFVSFLVLVYVQNYHFQLQSFKNMDMYWLDPTLSALDFTHLQSDASLHFALNGYCDYIRYVMTNYYICCLLYGLKMHDSHCLLSLISISSIDTILEYLNDDESFSGFDNVHMDDKDEIANNIQTAQKCIIEQLERVRNTFTNKTNTRNTTNHIIMQMDTNMVAYNTHTDAKDVDCEAIESNVDIHIIDIFEQGTKTEESKQDNETEPEQVPTIIEFQRAAFNIDRFTPNLDDKTPIFAALRAIAFDPYGTIGGVIDLQDEVLKQKLTDCEGTIEYLQLMGFRADESERYLVLLSPSADTLTNAVYGLNGFIPPLIWSKKPEILSERPSSVMLEWGFSSPNSKLHTVKLQHVQSKTWKSKRIVFVDDCEYFNQEASTASFTIAIDDIIAVITIEKLDPMWSDEAYKYDLVLDIEQYMSTFKKWKSNIFESMVADIPSQQELEQLRDKLLYHQQEYNLMLDLSLLEQEECIETMKHHHEEYNKLEKQYLECLKLIKNVHKPGVDFRKSAVSVYGFLRKYGGEMLPHHVQNLCIIYLASRYQTVPAVLDVLDTLKIDKTISKNVRLTTHGFIRKYGGSFLSDWIQNLCVSYVGERHFW